jgi:hypothetical protein
MQLQTPRTLARTASAATDLNQLLQGVARLQHAPRHPFSPVVDAATRDPGPPDVGTALAPLW